MLTLGSDPKGKWGPLEVVLMARVSLDERDDLAWAECRPPLRLGGHTHHVVLLQPRLLRESLWDVGDDPVSVYVSVTANEDETAERLTRTQVKVLDWGEVRSPLE